jgi:hypothetical protein
VCSYKFLYFYFILSLSLLPDFAVPPAAKPAAPAAPAAKPAEPAKKP